MRKEGGKTFTDYTKTQNLFDKNVDKMRFFSLSQLVQLQFRVMTAAMSSQHNTSDIKRQNGGEKLQFSMSNATVRNHMLMVFGILSAFCSSGFNIMYVHVALFETRFLKALQNVQNRWLLCSV